MQIRQNFHGYFSFWKRFPES